MRAFFLFLLVPLLSFARSDTFSTDRLKKFGEDFYKRQRDKFYEAGLVNQGGQGGGPVILSPEPKAGYLPVLITNDTGLPDDQVYVTLAGQEVPAGSEYFFSMDFNTGVYSPVLATPSTYSPTYSYLLSQLPTSTTGSRDHVAYVSNLNGARFYFSLREPTYLASKTGNAIAAPSYFAFYDPNFNNLFETVEVTYISDYDNKQPAPAIPWTATINTTEVDAFGLPIKIQYYSFDSSNPTALNPVIQIPNALPSGFGEGGLAGATTRDTILTSVYSGLDSGDLSGQEVWKRLAIPFYSDPYNGTGLVTYLRILSPKQGVGNDPSVTIQMDGGITVQHLDTVKGTGGVPRFYNSNFPFFPYDYFSSNSYGNANPFAAELLNFYTGGTNLYINTGGTTPAQYEGNTAASTMTFTLTSGSGPSPLTIDEADVNVYKMFSGTQEIGGAASPIGFYFGDAFTVGILPSATGTNSAAPINITDATSGGWQDTNVPNYYSPLNSAVSGGPWYSLYAKELHNVAVRTTFTTPTPNFLSGVGLCYAYDFDDSLGISGAITPKDTTLESENLYVRITLGAVDQNKIPDPYSDGNPYDVTFKFPDATRTLAYRQGTSGSFTEIPFNAAGTTINGLISNQANPLTIQYTVPGQGSGEFIVYLYNQFLVPQNAYSDFEISVINSSTITPDSITPSISSFTINLLP